MNLLEENNLKRSKSTSLRVEQSRLEEVSLRMRRELFYVKEDDYLLYGNRFQRELAGVFSEFRLTPPSGWVGEFFTTFGSHWTVIVLGGMIFTMVMSVYVFWGEVWGNFFSILEPASFGWSLIYSVTPHFP